MQAARLLVQNHFSWTGAWLLPRFFQSADRRAADLIIGGESLTRSLSFLLRKMLSEVTPGLQQLNGEPLY
jgi:hypothetical protein